MVELTDLGRKKIIDFLVKYTDYSRDFYEKMHNAQLYAVYMKYKEKRAKYIKDLSALDINGRTISGYSKSTLESFKLHMLKDIAEELSIPCDIHINSVFDENDDDRDVSYLTPNELEIMYGSDYIAQDRSIIRSDGYDLIEEDQMYTVPDLKSEITEKIVSLIIAGEFEDHLGRKYTTKKLMSMPFDDLVYLYRRLTVNLDEYIPYEDLEMQMRLMKV